MLASKTRLRRLLARNRGPLFLTALLAGCACVAFVLQPFGHRGWTFAMVSTLLAATAIRRSPARRLPNTARRAAIGALGIWLGLIAWAAASPSGPMLTPKDDPAAIRMICTWVRLRDRHSGRTLRVYNTHLYLTEQARLARYASSWGGSPPATAPTPCSSRAISMCLRRPPAIESSPKRAWFPWRDSPGRPHAAPTYQFYGIRLKCLDDIILSQDFRVRRHRIVDVKPGNTFPSDHFGILADITLTRGLDSRHPGHYIQTN